MRTDAGVLVDPNHWTKRREGGGEVRVILVGPANLGDSTDLSMGSLHVASWAWAAATAPEWGGRHCRCICHRAPLACPCTAASSLSAGQLLVETEHKWF